MTCMHALSESLYNPGNVPGSADQCIYGTVGSWFVASEIQNTQKAQQLGRTRCEMQDNASHAYNSNPVFCQLMSTYTDPFTSC